MQNKNLPLMFRSALPREERLRVTAATASFTCFDPRSRARSDRSRIAGKDRAGLFRSALPREERLKTQIVQTIGDMFRSALPREERRPATSSRLVKA